MRGARSPNASKPPLSGLVVDGKLHSGGRVVVKPDGEQNVVLRVA